MFENTTELRIGPLTYTYAVQKINFQERKAVEVLPVTRTDKHFIRDLGESDYTAQIRFIFPSLDDINGGIELSSTSKVSGLRGLIALFKSSPITVLKNITVTNTWKEAELLENKKAAEKMVEYFKTTAALNSAEQLTAQANGTASILTGVRSAVISAIAAQAIKDLSSRPQRPEVISQKVVEQLTSIGAEKLAHPIVYTKKVVSDWIPIAIERIEIENVPDLTNAFQVTLSIRRIDISSVTEVGEVVFSKVGKNVTNDPSDDTWLKVWINQILNTGHIPEVTNDDFKKATFSLRSYTSTADEEPLIDEFTLDISSKGSYGLLLAESCSVSHRYGFNKLVGKTIPMPSHMGSTARTLSLDIVFNNQENYQTYRKFCLFKETSDLLIKSEDRLDRLTGWFIASPISKLLGAPYNSVINEKPGEGLFVPLQVVVETAEQPHLLNCHIDLVESNLNFIDSTAITMTQGGTDKEALRKYYDKLLEDEFQFRHLLVSDPLAAINSIANQSNPELAAYSTVWPIENDIIKFDIEAKYGLINIDTLRALLLEPSIDSNKQLRKALQGSKLATGQVIASRRITFLDKLTTNYGMFKSAVAGLDLTDPELSRIREAISYIVRTKLFTIDTSTTKEQAELFYNVVTDYLTNGLLGDRTTGLLITSSSTGLAIDLLSKSKWGLSEYFKEGLFNVLIKREPKPPLLPYVYSTDGVYAGFFKLITKYTLEHDASETVEEQRQEIVDIASNKKVNNLYPDLLLPTYRELYKDDWQDYAPSIDDLGIDIFNEELTSDRSKIAVQEGDIVSPAAWFFIKRVKNSPTGLRSMAREAINTANSMAPSLSLSMPFNTEEIEDIKDIIGKTSTTAGTRTEKTLFQIIEGVLNRSSRSSTFRSDIVALSTKFGENFTGSSDKTIKVFIHHVGNSSVPKEVTIPGLGAEIYRVASKLKLLEPNDGLPHLDGAESYVTPLQKEIRFNRNLNESSHQVINSCLDQIPDDHYSAERLFPAAKVYLIDRRGSDLIADDTIFSVTSMLSIDITLDKQDAPLAVIKLADPLFNLQDDYFERSNVVEQEGGQANGSKKVLGSLRAVDSESYTRRYKLRQGRAIQIRMGYSSMAYNLPIVFTGRITEIVPGDVLTIVAQGWKAELINRQVNFANTNSKNWGARDLAIQAITQANPDGFGDFYPEDDAQFIIKELNKDDVTSVINHVLQNQQNVDIDTVGSRGIGNSIANWFRTLVGLRSTDRQDVGLDTRLKNIWYPDTALFSNIFGLSTKFGLMPSYINDSWIVPMQPAWDVLQEAARHAWNCIVEVVPYDDQATIFMGNPDQPYFFTRGTNLSRSSYNKYYKNKKEETVKTLQQLVDGFTNSKYYNSTPNIIFPNGIDKRAVLHAPLTDFSSLEDYRLSVQRFGYIGNFSTNLEIAISSTLPGALLSKAIDQGFYQDGAALLFSIYFNFDRLELLSKWPAANTAISEVLGSSNVDIEKFKTLIIEKLNIPNNVVSTSKYVGNYNKIIDALNLQIKELDLNPNQKDYDKFNNRYPFVLNYTIVRRTIDNIAIVEILSNDPIKTLIDSTVALSKRYIEQDPKATPVLTINQIKSSWESLITKLEQQSKETSNESGFSSLNKRSLPLTLNDAFGFHLDEFKAFVYFFSLYMTEDQQAQQIVSNASSQKESLRLPPNMKVFRVTHFVDSDHNIIQNNIVASTREMWNTVVLEHPSPGSAQTAIKNNSAEDIYTSGRISSGINWVYWPKQEVTGVLGLQFHPGLTLANKKIRQFTELNCQTADLSAKLACGHLAEGIRKMYRGNLLITGKNVKPHDRIVIADKYNRMSGPIEVESVIHHWNADQGWVTNITPNAICDANPGAAVLHTAVMETTYEAIFNTIEFLSDVATYATVIATLGGATPLAFGRFSTSQGISRLLTRVLTNTPKQTILKTLGAYRTGFKRFGRTVFKEATGRGTLTQLLARIVKGVSGPGIALLKNEMMASTAEWGDHMLFKFNVIPAFVAGADNIEQLPVILSPLTFNGLPFTAGLETEDSIWAIAANGIFYGMKDLQAGAGHFLSTFFS